MIKYIIVLALVFGIGCYGGTGYSARESGRRSNELKTGLIYDINTGKTEWVNAYPLLGSGGGRKPSYMNYETGEIYLPLVGDNNYYIKPDGGLIQPY